MGTKTKPANGLRNVRIDFLEELAQLVRVREADRELTISKQRAVVKVLVTAAVKGDVKAAAAVVALASRTFTNDGAKDEEASPDDVDILGGFVNREARRRAAITGEDPVTTATTDNPDGEHPHEEHEERT